MLRREAHIVVRAVRADDEAPPLAMAPSMASGGRPPGCAPKMVNKGKLGAPKIGFRVKGRAASPAARLQRRATARCMKPADQAGKKEIRGKMHHLQTIVKAMPAKKAKADAIRKRPATKAGKKEVLCGA